MARIGVFRIKETFNVKERGIVLVGYLVEGLPKVGAFLDIQINDKITHGKIWAVTPGNIDSEGILFALDISFEDQSINKFLEANKIQAQVVEINADFSKTT